MRKLTSHIVEGQPYYAQPEVKVADNKGTAGANHKYIISHYNGERSVQNTLIDFQDGPIKEVGINGISNECLLAILLDRLEGFQSSAYSCHENQMALEKGQEMMMWLLQRTRLRMQRGVEGTHQI